MGRWVGGWVGVETYSTLQNISYLLSLFKRCFIEVCKFNKIHQGANCNNTKSIKRPLLVKNLNFKSAVATILVLTKVQIPYLFFKDILYA